MVKLTLMHNHKDIESIKTRQFTFSRVNRNARSVKYARIYHNMRINIWDFDLFFSIDRYNVPVNTKK